MVFFRRGGERIKIFQNEWLLDQDGSTYLVPDNFPKKTIILNYQVQRRQRPRSPVWQ